MFMQELGNDDNKLHHSDDSEEEDEYQAMRRIEWKEEKEKAKIE